MNEKYSFDADALKYATDGDGFADTVTGMLDDYAFLALSPLFAAFDDFDEDFYSVTHIKLGEIALEKRGFDFLNNGIHGLLVYIKRSEIVSQ